MITFGTEFDLVDTDYSASELWEIDEFARQQLNLEQVQAQPQTYSATSSPINLLSPDPDENPEMYGLNQQQQQQDGPIVTEADQQRDQTTAPVVIVRKLTAEGKLLLYLRFKRRDGASEPAEERRAINRAIAQIEANQHEQPDNQINPSNEPIIANNIGDVQPLDFFGDLNNALNNLRNQQGTGNPDPKPPDSATVNDQETAQPSCSTHNAVDAADHEPSTTTRCERFNNVEIIQPLEVVRCVDELNYAEYYCRVTGMLETAAERAFQQAGRQDVVQFELRSDNPNHNASVILRGEEGDRVLLNSFIDRVVQSNMTVSVDSNLHVVAQIIRNTHGAGKRLLAETLDSEILKKKRRFLYVVDNEHNSLFFAMNLAHLLNPNITDNEALTIGKSMQNSTGMSDDTAVTLSDIPKFEAQLNCKIVVLFRTDTKRTLSKFVTDSPRKYDTLFMFLHENHYYGIISAKAFLGCKNVCNYCYEGYNNPATHKCPGHCSVCLHPSCTDHHIRALVCPDCNRTCRSPLCFNNHKEPKDRPLVQKRVSQCNIFKKCLNCNWCYYIPLTVQIKPQECSKLKCKICGCNVECETHRCYIQPLKQETEYSEKLVFYDFETYLDGKGVHVPFLVCTKTLYGKIWNAYGEDCAVCFILHFRRPLFRNSVFIAHNSRGFDSYLLIKTMLTLNMLPGLTMQGSKVICFTDDDYKHKYVGSLSFLTMRLADMPKALGFEDAVKGFFPHGFSSANTLTYVGPHPPPQTYGLERMSGDGKREFETWYETGYIGETGVDPFSCVTIASACMKVFRTNFLAANTLAIPSPDNYRRQFKSFSDVSIQCRCISPPNKTDNVFVAAFTPAYGRLTLYSYLQQLQDRVLYFDTDSLIYVSKEDNCVIRAENKSSSAMLHSEDL
ncbi:hypothetical protein F2P81_001325 [Scophthalmus maximus]|uniref:Uncharacterized protein n=1 Tax=Scophthalmus maximus TaxID=52904 RepID=A0A6A4U052_SCOMX|nr:hypothetical protein F2P81_001325 [Scophthalmus maximus]